MLVLLVIGRVPDRIFGRRMMLCLRRPCERGCRQRFDPMTRAQRGNRHRLRAERQAQEQKRKSTKSKEVGHHNMAESLAETGSAAQSFMLGFLIDDVLNTSTGYQLFG